MRSELHLGSRHRHLVFYDPAALPSDTPVDPNLRTAEPHPVSDAVIADLAARGCALFLHIPEGDCDAMVHVLVGEELPDHLRERARPLLKGAALSVPTGHLSADGVEFMCLPGQVRREAEPAVIDVPPGDFGVEIFEGVNWKLQHRATEIARRTTTIDRLVGHGVMLYTIVGAAMIPANLLIVPGALLVTAWKLGWRTAVAVAGVILAVDFLVLASFWLLEVGQRFFPVLKRANDVGWEFEREHPDVVVVLRQPAPPPGSAAPALAVLELSTRTPKAKYPCIRHST